MLIRVRWASCVMLHKYKRNLSDKCRWHRNGRVSPTVRKIPASVEKSQRQSQLRVGWNHHLDPIRSLLLALTMPWRSCLFLAVFCRNRTSQSWLKKKEERSGRRNGRQILSGSFFLSRPFLDILEYSSITGISTNMPSDLTPEQQKIYIKQLEIEEITKRLKSNDLGIPADPNQR